MATKGVDKARKAAQQAKSRALNAAYKHKAAALKKAGVLSSRVDARKNITRATRTKINKFADVLEGRVLAVKAKPEIRAKYEGVLPQRGTFLLVDKERAKDKAKIRRGLVEIERPMYAPITGLRYGEEREVILPFKLVDMPSLVERLQEDETLDGLKMGDEMFAFRIDGWASKIGFADAKEMGDYISRNYAHLFKPGMARKVVKYLSFIRYRASGEVRAKEGHHTYQLAAKPDSRRKITKYDRERIRSKQANKKAIQRAKETPDQRAKRLAEQRVRSAQNRQRKFDEE